MEPILPIADDDQTMPVRAVDGAASPLKNRLRVVFDTHDDTLDMLVTRQVILGRGIADTQTLDLSPYGALEHGISRQHVRFDYRGGRWFITDLESQNGTRLNGLLLFPLVTTEIRSGARVHLGTLGMYFYFG